jgi:hypothetical protein
VAEAENIMKALVIQCLDDAVEKIIRELKEKKNYTYGIV